MKSKEKPKVHLVLASGGARGVAHIGVINRLKQAGYPIVEVVGCSMGAVIGGLYASGDLDPYTQWLLKLKRADIFKLMDFTITRHGFLKGEKVFSTILDFLGPKNIEDLPLRFRAVATNMHNGKEVVFTQGDLYQALRASISIPGIFTPVKYQNQYLIDGGVVNPLPLNLIQKKEGEIIVAVNINANHSAKQPENLNTPNPPEKNWLHINWPFFKKVKPPTADSLDPNLVNILQTSYDHMQNQLIKLMVQAHPPDLMVNISRDICGVFDFHKTQDLINAGEQAFDKALAENKNLV
jgi:NTE family protein